MKKLQRKEKGITLIALIITVIIMLILAGVAIGAIANGDGVFKKTKEASEMYEQSSQNENEKIQELMNEIDKYFSKSMDKENPVITEAIASETWGKTNSIKVIATDSGSVEQNNGIIGYGINQSSAIEPTYTSCDATTNLNVTINDVTANGTYYIWVKDQAGNTANKEVIVDKVDDIAPTTATIASSDITTTTATLTATGEDAESGIGKYEFYVDGRLYNIVTTSKKSANITLTFTADSHSCYVRVYDMAGNYKDSNTVTVTKHVHTDACYTYIDCSGAVRWNNIESPVDRICDKCGVKEAYFNNSCGHFLCYDCEHRPGSTWYYCTMLVPQLNCGL